jgi:hypothetical protein
MAGYIGSKASVVSSGAERKKTFTITGATTNLTGLNYTVGKVHVFQNGVRLVDGTDYTATNGTTITLTVAAQSGDNVVVISQAAFQVADALLTSGGTMTGDLTVQGAFTSVGIDDNADAVALTIDGSENVLIGQTTASSGTVGTSLRPDGRNFYCADGNYSAHFNRNSSDGAIAHFAKDDTIVGSIGCYAGSFGVGQGDTGIGFFANDNIVFPSTASALARDNAVDLGYTAGRFKDLYLSGGVYLGGTAAANKLEDYEEGTWTPVYVGSSSAGSYTYVENQGHYVRIGNQVTCWFNLTNITTSSTGSGVSQINGLPFAANFMAGFNSECVGNVTCHGWTGIDGDQCWPLVTDGQSYVRVYKMTGTNNDPSPVEPSHKVNNNSDIRGFVTYYIGG